MTNNITVTFVDFDFLDDFEEAEGVAFGDPEGRGEAPAGPLVRQQTREVRARDPVGVRRLGELHGKRDRTGVIARSSMSMADPRRRRLLDTCAWKGERCSSTPSR